MDINNKEELKKLLNFTFRISGDCPFETMPTNVGCGNTNPPIENCVMCWRKALSDRIEHLESLE